MKAFLNAFDEFARGFAGHCFVCAGALFITIGEALHEAGWWIADVDPNDIENPFDTFDE